MSSTNRELTNAFERYFSNRVEKAGAITPGQKKDLIAQLRRELNEDGRVPLPTGPVKVDPKHPAIRAALEGRAVTMGGKVISKIADDSISGRMEALPLPAKIAVMAGIFLIPLFIVILIMFGRGGSEPSEIVLQPTETATITATPEPPSPTTTPLPNATLTATPVPTQPPIIIEITPTPYAFALTEGDAPNSNNDPASIEIAGYSYILGTGVVSNGAWQPTGAEWLKGSYLRKIIGLPYEPEIANVLNQIRAGNVIKLRLRSGEIVKYKIAQTLRVQRQQIEVLAERSPSLAIVLYGEPSPERTVVIALAVQEPQDFSVYSIAQNRDSPIIVGPQPEVLATPTLVPIGQQTIITNTRTMTNALARLTVEVKACNEADDIGGQKPPKSKQKYMVCDLTLTAAEDGLGTTYSQEALAITDQMMLDNSIDWKPPPVPQPSGGLGNGSLNAGDQVNGRIVGVVSTNDPVLVWQQAGTKIIIQLE